MFSILLTGANGFIGQHLLDHLLDKYKVVALSRQNTYGSHKNLTWILADLADPDFVKKLPPQIDVVICLAQSNYFRDFPAFAEDIFQINIQSLFYLLEWARKIEVKKFIYTSSANIYNQENELISENNSPFPTSFYAQTKLIAETLTDAYQSYFATTILRLFTVYGPKQKKALIPSLIENIKNEQPVKIYGKSGIKLSPIFVTDVCKIIEKILLKDSNGNTNTIFNVSGSEKVDILQISNLIGKILNMTPIYEYFNCEEPKGWVGNNTKLMEHIGDINLIPIMQGLQKTIKL